MAKRERVFEVHWQKSDLRAVSGEKVGSGQFDDVTGQLFKADKGVANFESKYGEVDQAQNLLTLTGNVSVKGTDPEATLTCSRLVYDANAKVIRAEGNVRIDGKTGTLGPMPELLATPDLKTVATPDMFKHP